MIPLTHAWAADPCTCGHRRDQHKRGRRKPWPETGHAPGPCTQACMCTAWDIDAEQMLAEEAEKVALRRQGNAEYLATLSGGSR